MRYFLLKINLYLYDRFFQIYLDIKHVVQPGGYCAFDAFDADIESPHQLFSLVQDKKLDNWQGYW